MFESVETVGDYPWVINHNTAKATSYDGTNNKATSYLISEPIALAILNNLGGKGASFLVDNVMLLATDGGIVTE